MATFQAMRPLLRAQLAAGTDGSEAAITAPTVLLVSDTHDFDAAATDEFVSDLLPTSEVNPTGYARQLLAFSGPISINTDGQAVIQWTDTAFGNLGGATNATIGGAYIFDDTGNDATARLLYQIPFETPDTTDGTAYVVRWSNPTVRVAP